MNWLSFSETTGRALKATVKWTFIVAVLLFGVVGFFEGGISNEKLAMLGIGLMGLIFFFNSAIEQRLARIEDQNQALKYKIEHMSKQTEGTSRLIKQWEHERRSV